MDERILKVEDAIGRRMRNPILKWISADKSVNDASGRSWRRHYRVNRPARPPAMAERKGSDNEVTEKDFGRQM